MKKGIEYEITDTFCCTCMNTSCSCTSEWGSSQIRGHLCVQTLKLSTLALWTKSKLVYHPYAPSHADFCRSVPSLPVATFPSQQNLHRTKTILDYLAWQAALLFSSWTFSTEFFGGNYSSSPRPRVEQDLGLKCSAWIVFEFKVLSKLVD